MCTQLFVPRVNWPCSKGSPADPRNLPLKTVRSLKQDVVDAKADRASSASLDRMGDTHGTRHDAGAESCANGYYTWFILPREITCFHLDVTDVRGTGEGGKGVNSKQGKHVCSWALDDA